MFTFVKFVKNGMGEQEYRGDAEIVRYNLLVHDNRGKTLTDGEFANLCREDHREI